MLRNQSAFAQLGALSFGLTIGISVRAQAADGFSARSSGDAPQQTQAQTAPPTTPPPAPAADDSEDLKAKLKAEFDRPQPPPSDTVALAPPIKLQPSPSHHDSVLDRLGFSIGSFKADRNARRSTDTGWTTFELSYALRSRNGHNAQLIPGVYLEAADTDGGIIYNYTDTQITNGRHFIGAGLDERASIPTLHGTVSLSFGAGAGIYALESYRHYHFPDAISTDNNDDGSDPTDGGVEADRSGQRLGGHLFFAISHKSGLMLEARWTNAGELSGLGYRGASLSLGFRR